MTRHVPKWGEGEVDDPTLPVDLGLEDPSRQGTSLTKGQILWLRGITRLQTQVCNIKRINLIYSSCSLTHKFSLLLLYL